MTDTTHECTDNFVIVTVRDARAEGDGIEILLGDKPGFGTIISLEQLQIAFAKAGLSLLQREAGTHRRLGRRRHYLERGITRMPCFRCGLPSRFQWNICADGNIQRPICAGCDIELNQHVLAWSGDPNAKEKLEKYRVFVLPPIQARKLS